jgi:lysophospholipid acyltransferase (LPLAT)-like uncharacterized protein
VSLKQLLRRGPVRTVLCALAAAYIRLVHATSRWHIQGGDIPASFWNEGRPFILAFWHGRLLMTPCVWRKGVAIRMLISQHSDGQFISSTIRHFGIDTITGSSSRGGSSAMRAIIKALQTGTCVGFTPDGPRGPRMRASAGVVQAARLAGAPILPCAFAVRRRRALSSWDRFILAFPFTRGVFIWDTPITVGRDASGNEIEAARQHLEDRLNAITAEADRLAGAEPIMPDEAPVEQQEDDDEEGATRAVAGRP